jgi:hypothetical protein
VARPLTLCSPVQWVDHLHSGQWWLRVEGARWVLLRATTVWIASYISILRHRVVGTRPLKEKGGGSHGPQCGMISDFCRHFFELQVALPRVSGPRALRSAVDCVVGYLSQAGTVLELGGFSFLFFCFMVVWAGISAFACLTPWGRLQGQLPARRDDGWSRKCCREG